MSLLKFNIKINAEERALVNVTDFEIGEGKINFLFGESGIGKSIISKALFGLLDPDDLDIRINKSSYPKYLKSAYLEEIRNSGFFVFQEPSSHLNPMLTVRRQLNEGSLKFNLKETEILNRLWDRPGYEKLENILSVYPRPYRPSGGEKQRILAAMALKKIDLFIADAGVKKHNLFVFDEPTGNLDNYFRDVFLDFLIEKYRKRNFTILFITHDYSIISRLFLKHKDLEKNLIFRELRHEKGKQIQREFYPSEYLEWVNSEIKPAPGKKGKKDTLLSFNGTLDIFNMKLRLYHDWRREKPARLNLKPGDLVYLKAPSGAGKTTMVKCLAGLLKPDKMEFTLKGEKFDQNSTMKKWKENVWGKSLTMVFQHADEALNLNSNVRDTFKGLPVKEEPDDDKLKKYLANFFEFEITDDFLNRKIKYLSGGQKQKINLIRGFMLDTDILILDEPVNGMDFISIKQVLKILKQKLQENKAIMLISHSEEIFERFTNEESVYYLMEEGK